MGRYQDALDTIFSYVNYEKPIRFGYAAENYNLERMQNLLDRMGQPHRRFRCVHIAGTKGKGSTSAMVESVLRTAGYRTGLYTSPHLHTFRERIRCRGNLMPKAALVDLLPEVRSAIESAPGVTAFEIMTALAFTCFARENVEWAVLETGLGGRLDATNVVLPAVCGITSLSYDHMEVLGHTLTSIAQEKTGIVKPGVPVVSASQDPEAMVVIRDVCAQRGAPLIVAGVDWIAAGAGADLTGQRLDLRRRSDGLAWPGLRIALVGRHQLDNATVAVAALAELQAQGVAIPEKALREGLAAAQWPGRFELLSRQPALVVDCAHNTDSALKLRATLADFFPGTSAQRLALVFGASADKDIAGMLEVLLTGDQAARYAAPVKVIVTRSGHPRQADPKRLAEIVRSTRSAFGARGADCPVSVCDSLDAALADAVNWATHDDVICVTGSIFVVAQARKAWARQRPGSFSSDDWVFQDETPGEIVSDDETVSTDKG